MTPAPPGTGPKTAASPAHATQTRTTKRLRFESLRSRVLLGTTVACSLLTATAGIIIHRAIYRTETQEFNDNLIQIARTLTSLTAPAPSDANPTTATPANAIQFAWDQFDPHLTMDDSRKDSVGILFAINSPKQTLATNNTIYDAAVLANTEPWPDTPTTFATTLPDGTPARGVRFPFVEHLPDGKPGPTLLVTVVRRSIEIEELSEKVIKILLWVGIGMVALACLAMHGLLQHALRGLKPMGDELANLNTGDLSQTIHQHELPTEFTPLIASINGLLANLNKHVQREKRFVADAAHELRTPIATVLSNLELVDRHQHAQHPKQPTDPALTRALEASRHMQRACERLLMLARLESAAPTLDHIQLQLAEFIDHTAEAHEQTLAEQSVTLRNRTNPHIELTTDPTLLSIAISNLVHNAAHHGQSPGELCIDATESPNTIDLTFENPAPAPGSGSGCNSVGSDTANTSLASGSAESSGIDIARVTEPFWRGNRTGSNKPNAAQDTGHAGLGLAITDAAIRALGGTMACQCIASKGDQTPHFQVRLTLPKDSSQPRNTPATTA